MGSRADRLAMPAEVSFRTQSGRSQVRLKCRLSAKTRPPGTLGGRKRGWETSADLLLSLSRRQPCFFASNQGLVPGVVAQGGQVTVVLQIVDDNTGGNLVGTGFQQLQRSVEFIHQRCLVPGFDGALFSPAWRDALWAKFFT